MSRSLLLSLLLSISCLAGVAHGADLSAQDQKALLTRLQQSRTENPSASTDFTELKRSRLLKEPITAHGTVMFQAPDKFRREVTGESPSLTVSDGKTLWIYYPNFKEAERYTLGLRAAFDDSIGALTAGLNFAHLDQFYDVIASRDEGGYKLDLVPRRGALRRTIKKLTVWLDDNLMLRRTELLMGNGDFTTTTYTHQNRKSLAASVFEFSPPAGTNVTQPLGK